jgi:hypothetical protein
MDAVGCKVVSIILLANKSLGVGGVLEVADEALEVVSENLDVFQAALLLHIFY